MMSKTLIHALRSSVLAGLLALSAGQVLAVYKVVLPDGSIIYTDRPPTTPNARVTELNRNSSSAGSETTLPVELRQVATRYPVVLYTTADCAPCDSGRRLLQQRGVPYAERRVLTDDDAAALERVVGGRSVPALTIGAQPLRGYSETDWGAYLDAAGYPRSSVLPRGWPVPEASPMTERATPAPAPSRAPSRAAQPAEDERPQPTPGVRF